MGQLTQSSLSTLLRDEDPAIISLIRKQLLDLGSEDITALERFLHCDDAVVTRNIQEILDQITLEQNSHEFLLHCHSFPENGDLEEAIWKLAATVYPKASSDAGRVLFDVWARKLQLRLTDSDDARKGIRDMSAFVTYELGFHANESSYYDPDNSFMNRVVETRAGIPITLSLVYLFLARRLNLPVRGIGLPGRFICAWSDVYFDPFNKGAILSRDDCARLLEDMGIAFQESFLNESTSKAILMRVIHNLVNIYVSRNDQDMQQKMINFIVALQS